MRLLFVSSTTVGGSGRSQRELAMQLTSRGHRVQFLVDTGRPARLTKWAYGNLSDLAVRLGDLPGGAAARWLEGIPGRATTQVGLDGWIHESSPVPQNAIVRHIETFRPDLVVGNSLERLAWRRIQRVCHRFDVPTVLYVRETDSLSHLDYGEVPDLLIANAASLQEALRDRGFECEFVPSVIDVGVTLTESSRSVALAINPIQSRGADIIWRLAARDPTIPIVVQESWPLEGPELAAVEHEVETLPNLTFRRTAPAGPQLYGDARVLLVPYRVDNRPRVIAEAQANGIPVIAADVPALREAIGEGGVVVPLDDIDAWTSQLRSLWTDQQRYERMSDAALAHSKRSEIDPAAVAGRFEELVTELLRSRR